MKSKPITILAVTFLIVAAIIFCLIRPVISSIWDSWRNLEKARAELQNIEEKKKILEALKNNPDVSSVGQIALKYIPKDTESGELVVELAAIAQTNNLKVEEITMEKSKETPKPEEETEATKKSSPTPQITPTNTSGIKEVTFSIKVSGAYTDLIAFLRGIESSSRLIAIKNLALQVNQSQNKDTPNAITLSSQMSGTAYYKTEILKEETIQNIQVTQDTIDKFLNLKTFGSPINLPAEQGSGRSNPFENY